MLDTTVTPAHFNTEANSIYETLFTSWLPASKEVLRLQVTPFTPPPPHPRVNILHYLNSFVAGTFGISKFC